MSHSTRAAAALAAAVALSGLAAPAPLAPPAPLLVIDRDDVEITASCTVRVAAGTIVDGDGDGVVHITADGITVDFDGSTLRGSGADRTPDTFAGIGIRITAENVTLRGATIGGFKTGIYATNADGLRIEECVLADNWRPRLRVTPPGGATGERLRPRANDHHEWLTNYGAGVCVERSDRVVVRRVKVRHGQNGIILDRVNLAEIYDNDCSFLSGWGLALWRSDRNVVSRNAFDFCVRGDPHGPGDGEGSAGIVMFEQCSENLVVENSATHGGNGLVVFAGRVALGEIESRDEPDWYRGRGSNRNRIIRNDFSDALADGVRTSFGFANEIVANRLADNGGAGVRGDHSRDAIIAFNTVRHDDGDGEGGLPATPSVGVAIGNGGRNLIAANEFEETVCGVSLWADADEPLLRLPWYTVNARGRRSQGNRIRDNVFRGNAIGIRLRRSTATIIAGNRFSGVGARLECDEPSRPGEPEDAEEIAPARHDDVHGPGTSRPVGARAHRRGREHIRMTEWGPRDPDDTEG